VLLFQMSGANNANQQLPQQGFQGPQQQAQGAVLGLPQHQAGGQAVPPVPAAPPQGAQGGYAQGVQGAFAQGAGNFQQAQAWQQFGLGGAGGPGGHNVNGNALLNANYALNSAAWAEAQARLASQQCEALAKSYAKTERWSRDLRINQEKAKYKAPADKKAVEYLVEEDFDLRELYSLVSSVTPDDNTLPVVTAANCRLVEATLQGVVSHLQMRMRKRKCEEESYRIARESTFGWKTEKMFRKDPIFDEGDYDDDTAWWQKPELSKEKKKEKLKNAESQVKFQMTNGRKMLNQGKFRGGFQNGFQNQYPKFNNNKIQSFGGQSRLPYGNARQDSRQCHQCWGVGHISRFCPQGYRPRPQFQQQYQRQGQLQLQQQGAQQGQQRGGAQGGQGH